MTHPHRHRLPATRPGWIHTVTIAGKTRLTFIVGLNADGQPAELFVKELESDDASQTTRGALDAWATEVSIGLQSGRTVQELTKKYIGTHWPPNGFTDDSEIHFTTSPADFISRWMFRTFGGEQPCHT